MDATPADPAALADAIDAALPQTQCTRCGEPDCRRYAEAVAAGTAGIDRCPPGGAEGIARLAALTGRPLVPLVDPAHGIEGPLRLAVIDEAWCIGCTLCIKACPVDCIVGAAQQMHTVIASRCTGCELCIPVCPVDCIALVDATPGRSGWAAWSPQQADAARRGYGERQARRARAKLEHDARLAAKAARPAEPVGDSAQPSTAAPATKRDVVAAALERARARRGAG